MGPRSATKDVSTFLRNEVQHPQKSSSSSPNPPACSLFLSLPFFHQESLWHSRLLHFSRCSSIETEFSICSSLVEYSKTAQLHLHNETSLCQCEGINTQWSHCDQWHTSCIYKCLANAAEAIKEGGSFFYCFFFFNCRLFLKLKFLHLPTFFFHFKSVEK